MLLGDIQVLMLSEKHFMHWTISLVFDICFKQKFAFDTELFFEGNTSKL